MCAPYDLSCWTGCMTTPGLAAELLQDPVVRRRNRIALDWDNAWRLDTGGSDHLDREVIDVSVRFAARIPVRPVRLIAEGDPPDRP